MKVLYENMEGVQVWLLTMPSEVTAFTAEMEALARSQGWQPQVLRPDCTSAAACFAAMVGGELAGGLHLTTPDSGGLPCLGVWPELELQGRTGLGHVRLLALKPAFRGRYGLLWPLCVEMWRYCRTVDIAELWMEVTPANLRIYRRLGWPLHVAGPRRPHWGEDCYPCYLRVQEVKDAIVQKAEKSLRYRAILANACRDGLLPHTLLPLERDAR